jgi:pyruvate formate lyase activating enzyme
MQSVKNMLSGLKKTLTISGLVKSSLVDYPGLVCCTLFVPGCNYDCFYCHNRSLLESSPDILPFAQVENFLKKRIGLLDGVVITGGESTLQPDLIPFIKTIKELGFKIKLDTNGSSPQVIEQLLRENLCDYFAVDYKAPSARYQEICGSGANPELVLQTISCLFNHQADFEVRTTVIPQLVLDDFLKMAEELPPVPRYVLNPYRVPKVSLPQDKARVEKKPYTQDQISSFAFAIKHLQPHVMA